MNHEYNLNCFCFTSRLVPFFVSWKARNSPERLGPYPMAFTKGLCHEAQRSDEAKHYGIYIERKQQLTLHSQAHFLLSAECQNKPHSKRIQLSAATSTYQVIIHHSVVDKLSFITPLSKRLYCNYLNQTSQFLIISNPP